MSFIVAFKNNDFVIMAGDKRETFVDGSRWMGTIIAFDISCMARYNANRKTITF